ncbi:MAG TPA: ATP-binding protein [Planctomycetota bacterium]|nr:ATP-binding protein [Planctomycetota bacterium]
MPKPAPLLFKIAPHIVEDLGMNLYTTLPRVLVEFIANAYDADANFAKVTFDAQRISQSRKKLRAAYKLEMADYTENNPPPPTVVSLERRTLPEDEQIVIEDDGHGMSRDDIDKKFLFAGRRRRKEDAGTDRSRMTEGGRPLMGRKGLGKLAGFGVAKKVEVISRCKGEDHATKITLHYDQLTVDPTSREVEVPEERVKDGGGFANGHGTRIILSQLLYDPLKSRPKRVVREIAEHFEFIDPNDFEILMNGTRLERKKRVFAYAWPKPNLPKDEFVERTLPRESGGEVTFKYRIRFTGRNQALLASRRGIRIYAHKRLAAAPSLLDADTNMHGFRTTDYMDGVVHADFIDEQEIDYIGTDRQSLRWESPMLSPLKKFLSKQITKACKKYQALRDKKAKEEVERDSFTENLIARQELTRSDKRIALRIAALLESVCKRGVKDRDYKERLPHMIESIGRGNLMATLAKLANEDQPELRLVAPEIVELSKDEFDQFLQVVKGRLNGIEALKKIVKDVDFKKGDNEKVLQDLLEKCPWLINPMYAQVLSANQTVDTLFNLLAKELKVGLYAATNKNDDRPDLVFLLGSVSLGRLVIVELKSANKELEDEHLTQLLAYMETAREWLDERNAGNVIVHGQLIGSLASGKSKARGVLALRQKIRTVGQETLWTVRDYGQVLVDAEAAHREILEVQRSIQEQADSVD